MNKKSMIYYALLFMIYTIVFISGSHGNSDVTYGDFIGVEYVKNYDGDTITVNIKDVHPLIGSLISIRVSGIDTPEMKSDCPNEKIMAYNAKVLVEKLFKNSKVITLKNVSRDKYFRILADVDVDGTDVAKMLIKNKVAIPYNGGTKTDWCKE